MYVDEFIVQVKQALQADVERVGYGSVMGQYVMVILSPSGKFVILQKKRARWRWAPRSGFGFFGF